MSCCPPGSWPSLKSDYTPCGTTTTTTTSDDGDGLSIYHHGSTECSKAILVIHDVFGPDSGRLRAIVDHIANEGYFCVMADLYRGDPIKGVSTEQLMEWGPKFPWDLVRAELLRMIRFVQSKGITKMGLIGFCWGCWVNFKIANDEELSSLFSASVNCHPSVGLEKMFFGGDPIALAKGALFGPHLLLSAGNDPDFVHPGGEYETILSESYPESKVVSFKEMAHGWVNRGDVTDETVKPHVERAIALSIEFLKKHVVV